MQTKDTSETLLTGDSAVAHLSQALDATDETQANFHIRQAMQLLIADEE
jgi:hypothetical protein